MSRNEMMCSNEFTFVQMSLTETAEALRASQSRIQDICKNTRLSERLVRQSKGLLDETRELLERMGDMDQR